MFNFAVDNLNKDRIEYQALYYPALKSYQSRWRKPVGVQAPMKI